MTGQDAFDPRRIVETLNRHHVDYVLIGGYAARLYGARRPTYDLDITPSTSLDNLHRLSMALRELDAGIRVDGLDERLPFDSSAESLQGMKILNLRTPAGDLDLTFTPAGTAVVCYVVRPVPVLHPKAIPPPSCSRVGVISNCAANPGHEPSPAAA